MSAAAPAIERPRLPESEAEWHELLMQIPGFDPFACNHIKGVGDCYFDQASARRAIDFIETQLCHVEGAVARMPFILESWERCIIANLFGWLRPGGSRRFREVMVYIARKNGKTPLAAAIALYMLFADGEIGAVVQCAATSHGQASKLFRHAAGMVRLNKGLRGRTKILNSNAERKLVYEATESTLEAIHASPEGQHGGNPSCVVVDELHAFPDFEFYGVLRTSMASANRRHSIFLVITTADVDRDSPCNEMREHAVRVRDGLVDDPTFLPAIYEGDVDDDYREESTWRKANPNLGVSVSIDYLRSEAKKAESHPSIRNDFKRLNCNIRTSVVSAWIDVHEWDQNVGGSDPARDLDGWPCAIAVDLSATRDMTAVVTVLKVDDVFVWIPRYFVPEGFIPLAGRYQRMYEDWAEDGVLTVTEGETVDYALVEDSIVADAEIYRADEIHFDRKFGGSMMSRLQDEHGLTVVEVNQGITSMSPMLKLVDTLVGRRRIDHRGHPILRWNIGGAMVKKDENENIKLVKNKSTSRIDGLIAGTMATFRLAATAEEGSEDAIVLL